MPQLRKPFGLSRTAQEPSYVLSFLELLRAEQWHEDAACRDHPKPDRFYAEERRWSDPRYMTSRHLLAVVELCAGCPVRRQCLEAGLRDEWGVWGGSLPADRRDVAHLPPEIALRHLEARFEAKLEQRRERTFKPVSKPRRRAPA